MTSDLLSSLAPAITALIASADANLGGAVDSPISLSGVTNAAPARYPTTTAEQWASRLPDSTVIALAGNSPAPAPTAPLTPADMLFQSALADPFTHELFSNPPWSGAPLAGPSSAGKTVGGTFVSAAPISNAAAPTAPVTGQQPQFVGAQQDLTLVVGYTSGVGSQSGVASHAASGSGVGHGSGSGSGSASSSGHASAQGAAVPMRPFGKGSALASGPSSGSGGDTGPFTWVGGDPNGPDSWEIADNWLRDGMPAYSTPGQYDDVIFDGSVSNASCTAYQGEEVQSVTVNPNYTSTITLQNVLIVESGGFDFEGGNINEGPFAEGILVNGPFTWDNPAGNAVMNIGSDLANLVLTGNATIRGTNLVTKNLITIAGTVDFNTTGSLTFDNGAGITISSGGIFNWNSTANIVVPGAGATASAHR